MTEKKHKSLSLTTAHNGLIIQIRRIVLEHGKGRRRCRVAATIKDIAAAAGVSRGTVDRVLHGRGGVCPEVREKVLQLAEELEYRPNRAALGLAALKKPVRIGLLLPSEGNPFFGEVIRGAKAAEKSLSDYGTALLPEPVRGYDTAGHLRALQSLEERGADGVCAATVDVPEVRAAISALAERGEHEGGEDVYAYDGVKAAAVEVKGEILRAADTFHAEGPRAAPALEAVAHAEYAGQMPVYEGVAVAYHLAVDAGQEIERVDYSALAAAFAGGLGYGPRRAGVSAAGRAGQNQ